MKTLKPYLGITNVRSSSEIRHLFEYFVQHRSIHTEHRLQVGVLVERLRMSGHPSRKDAPDWEKNTLSEEEVRRIFVPPCAGLSQAIHYIDSDRRGGIDLYRNLCRATEWGGPHMTSLQLGMCWPNKDELRWYRKEYPDVEIILHIGKKAALYHENKIMAIVAHIVEYVGLVDHILLNMSGRGIHMESELLIRYLEALEDSGFGLGVAGSLSPETLYLLDPIWEYKKDISTEALTKLTSENKLFYIGQQLRKLEGFEQIRRRRVAY